MANSSTITAELTDPVTQRVLSAGSWSVNAQAAAGTASSVTQPAAGGASVRNVAKNITVTISCGATPQPTITVALRDGASGAGPILWQAVMSCPANDSRSIPVPGMEYVGSPNTAMCLEFTSAPAANVTTCVSMSGYLATQ